MKKWLACILPISLLNLGCTSFGNSPSDKEIQKYKLSNNFSKENSEFQNRRPKLVEEMYKKNMSLKAILKFLFTQQEGAAPDGNLPEVKPDLTKFLAQKDGLYSIWFGHTTFLLNIEGKIILVDPVFSDNASPVSFTTKRFQKPVLSLEELPEIDYVLISHDHYDHLDMKTIKYLKNKDLKFVTPLGVGEHLKYWGVNGENIIEKDWWESFATDDVEFIATPAQHFSGRGLFDRNKTLWASWVIRSKKHSVYFSGDSGYDTHFKDIGEKYGPFDVAFLETGQYNEKWAEVHMLPDQGVKAYKDLKAKKYFPVHWGMFILAMHKWNDPMFDLFKAGESQEVNFVVPKFGEIVNLNENYQINKWWLKTEPKEKLAEERVSD